MSRVAKIVPAHLIREAQVQRRVIKLFRTAGARVYLPAPWTRTGSPSATPGIADLFVVHPARGVWWFECKRPGGKQSEDQKEFQRVVEGAGMRYVVGGYAEAVALLVALQIIVPQPPKAA